MYYIISAALLLAPFLLPPTAAAPTAAALASPEAIAAAIANDEGFHRSQRDRDGRGGRDGVRGGGGRNGRGGGHDHAKFKREAEPIEPAARFEHPEPHFEGRPEEGEHFEKRSNVGLRPQKRWGGYGGGCGGCGGRGGW